MPAIENLDALRAEYAAIEQRSPNQWTIDEEKSVQFYAAEEAMRGNRPLEHASFAVTQWVRNLVALERFTTTEGFPRKLKIPMAVANKEELSHLINWVATQRTHDRCSYQVRRLACIYEYVFYSDEGKWQIRFEQYEEFLATYKDPPKDRSGDPDEEVLTDWAAKQRVAYRSDKLSADKVARLEGLRIWSWGKPTK
jgi:hypothetical protein